MLERKSYLIQNQLNPFPISGVLSLSDDGRLRFTLDAGAADCFLGWLEKALATTGLKERIRSGERPVVFDLPIAQRKIRWPKSLLGYGMKIDDDQRNWVVTLIYPSDNSIWGLVNMVKNRRTAKPWKDAFSAAGVA